MIAGKKDVLGVNCGEEMGVPIVAQALKDLVCIDIIQDVIKDNTKRLKNFKNIEFQCFDISLKP